MWTWTSTSWVSITDAGHLLEIDWQAAASDATHDGVLTLWVDETQQGSLTNLDNDTRKVDYVEFGAPGGTSLNQLSGTLLMDAYESRRESQIGLEPGGMNFGDALFTDDFESGDFSGWSSSTTDSGRLSVTAQAALVGSQGMQANLNATTTSKYVTDLRPYDEAHYRAHFHFDPNTIAMSSGNAHYILQALSYDNSTVIARVEFKCNAAPCASNYRIAAQAQTDTSGTWTTATYYAITDAPHTVEIDWQAATAAGANNGVLTLWIDGTQQQSLTNIDNDTRRVHSVRLGGVSGVDTGTNGTEYLDGSVSRRATYIGLVPNDGLSLAKTEGKGGKVLAKLVAPGVRASSPAEETGITITYTYDPLDRLTAADYSNGVYFHYTYDEVGNRLTETTALGTTTYVYDAANRLVSVNGTPYTWDNNGNLLSDGVKTYTFDHANRLKTVTGPGLVASYVYNGLGDRVSQTVNDVTTDFTLDLAVGLTQVLQDGTYTYLYGNERIAQESEVTTEYFLGDALGSLRQLVDEDGVITLAQEYKPYGEILASEGSGTSDFAFTGENFDSQTGLLFLRARYLDVSDGRFLSRDMWAGDANAPMSYNLWLYGYSNPITYIDPLGLYSEKVVPNVQFSPVNDPLWRGALGLQRKNGAQEIVWEGNKLFNLCGQVSVSAILAAVLHPKAPTVFQVLNEWKGHMWNPAKDDVTSAEHIDLFINSAYGSYLDARWDFISGLLFPTNKGVRWDSEEGKKETPRLLKELLVHQNFLMVSVKMTQGGRLGATGAGHWVVLTGVSNPFDYENRASEKNWVRVYNPYDNETEYYTWNDFYDSFFADDHTLVSIKIKSIPYIPDTDPCSWRKWDGLR